MRVGHIAVVVEAPVLVALDQRGCTLGVGRLHRGDEKAVLAVANGLPVAIPVTRHHREASRHRLHRREPEGLLDIVRERNEEVGCAISPLRDAGFTPVHPINTNAGGRSRFIKTFSDRLVGKPAAFENPNTPAAGGGRPRAGKVHGQGIGLGVQAQAAHEQHDNIVVGKTVSGARLMALLPISREVGRMHP